MSNGVNGQPPHAWWKSPSFIGACVGAVAAIALNSALATPHSGGPDVVRFLGRFHPLVVHLPIGFLILIGFAEALTLIPKARPRIDPALGLLLPPLLLSAVGAFMLGLLLAHDGGYPAKLVALHRIFTLGAVVGSAVCLAVWSTQGEEKTGTKRALYRAALGLTLGLVTVGAHFGGSITRGDTYLTKYAPAFAQRLLGTAPKDAPTASAAPADAASDPLVYRDVVAPVLKSRCGECHGDATTKAGLRLDSLEAILKGGENGPALVAGRSDKSSLMTRMLLPAEVDEHMPPEGKPQLSPEEIDLVRFWIDRGASDSLHVKDALAPESARSLLAKSISPRDVPPSAALPSAAPSASSASPPADSSAAATSTATPGGATSKAPSTGPISAHSGVAWDDAIHPILQSRCAGCHGAEKQKGKLRVDSIAALLAGGKAGPAVVAGDPPAGTLLTRVHLPLESDDHMPPKKETQLSPGEIELLAYWIQHGANADVKTASIPARLLATKAPPAPAVPAAPSASTAPPTPSSTASVAVDPSKLPVDVHLYGDVVKPMLDARCGLCHSGEDPSGELDVDDLAKLHKSGAIVPGNPSHSKLVARVVLPMNDSDHMPPEGNAQTERGEIDALKLWIQKGASPDLVVKASSLTPDVAFAAATMLAKENAPKDNPPPGDASSAPSAEPMPSVSASGIARVPPPSRSAEPAGPPSLGPGSGCAACTVGNDDAPFWASAIGAALGLAALVVRRTRRR